LALALRQTQHALDQLGIPRRLLTLRDVGNAAGEPPESPPVRPHVVERGPGDPRLRRGMSGDIGPSFERARERLRHPVVRERSIPRDHHERPEHVVLRRGEEALEASAPAVALHHRCITRRAGRSLYLSSKKVAIVQIGQFDGRYSWARASRAELVSVASRTRFASSCSVKSPSSRSDAWMNPWFTPSPPIKGAASHPRIGGCLSSSPLKLRHSGCARSSSSVNRIGRSVVCANAWIPSPSAAFR